MSFANTNKQSDPSSSPARLWKRVIATLVGIGLAIMIGELLLRLIGFQSQIPLWWVQLNEIIQTPYHTPNSQTDWDASELTFSVSINSRGLPDAEHSLVHPGPGTYRILLIGDSFVEAGQVSFDEAFGRQLAVLLNEDLEGLDVEVIVAGFGGIGIDRELLWYQLEGAQYEPDLVLLSFYLGNDVLNNSREFNRHLNYYQLRSAYFELGSEDLRLVTPPEQRSPTDLALRHNFQVYRVIAIALEAVRKVGNPTFENATLPWAADADDPRFPTLDKNLFQYLVDPLPEVDSAWQLTGAILNEFAIQANTNGSDFKIALLVDRRQVVDELWAQEMVGLTPEEQAAFDVRLPYNRILALLEEEGFVYIDTYLAFRQAVEASDTPYYFVEDGHFTTAGHEIAAQTIALALSSDIQALSPSENSD